MFGFDPVAFRCLVTIVRRANGFVLALARVAGMLWRAAWRISHGLSSASSTRKVSAIQGSLTGDYPRLQSHGCGRESLLDKEVRRRVCGRRFSVDVDDQHALTPMFTCRRELEKSTGDLTDNPRALRLSLGREEQQFTFAATEVRRTKPIDQDHARACRTRRPLPWVATSRVDRPFHQGSIGIRRVCRRENGVLWVFGNVAERSQHIDGGRQCELRSA